MNVDEVGDELSPNPRSGEGTAGGARVSREARQGARRPHCLLSLSNEGRGLSRALFSYLSSEVPEICFALERAEGQGEEVVDSIWVCGYDEHTSERIVELRAHHPAARILVTRRDASQHWSEEARQAGADFALPWPLQQDRIVRILMGAGVTSQASCR